MIGGAAGTGSNDRRGRGWSGLRGGLVLLRHLPNLLGGALPRSNWLSPSLRCGNLLACFCLNFGELKPINDLFTQRCINA